MPATYTPNRRGMRELATSRMLFAGLAPVANAIEQRAKSSAPVETGNYRDSIRQEYRLGPTRVGINVFSDADSAIGIEKRTGNLGKAAG